MRPKRFIINSSHLNGEKVPFAYAVLFLFTWRKTMDKYTFLIQTDSDDTIDTAIIKYVLDSHKALYDYDELALNDLDTCQFSDKKYIPVGNIDFVRKAIQLLYNPNFVEQPIEIPIYLQTPEFLKRIYKVCRWNEIPRTGKWFLKDASQIKFLSLCTNMEFFINDEIFDYKPKHKYDASLSLPKTDDYIISSPYQIQSKYRLYIIDDRLENMSSYGDDILPLPDMDLINKAIKLINANEPWLKSYSLDVMVGPTGTAIIEIHNFASLGLYSATFDKELRTVYIQGIDYFLNDNSIKYK